MNRFYLVLMLLFIASCSSPTQLSSDVCEIAIQDYNDKDVLVLNRTEIDYLMQGDIIDAPISLATKTDGKRVWILPTALQQNGDIYLSHTFVIGDLQNVEDAEIITIDEERLFSYPEKLEKSYYGRHWITNIVQTDEGLIALLHSEYTRDTDVFGMDCAVIAGGKQCAPGRSQISLAWLPIDKFEKNDFSFEFLGHISGSYSDVPHFNVHGTPWYFSDEKDGNKYLNLIFADGSFVKRRGKWRAKQGGLRIGQLRANFKDLMTAISTGENGSWTKYTKAGWVSPDVAVAKAVLPIIPNMTNVDTRIANGRVVVHSDAIYHEPTGAHFLSSYVLERKRKRKGKMVTVPSSLIFYKACPGENWSYVGRYHPRRDGKKGWSYLSLISSDDTDFGQSRGNFDLMSGWDYGELDRKILRMNVEVSKGCACE